MELNDVKACLRALITSSKSEYNLKQLLKDFKEISGCDLPLFGYKNSVDFLQSISDTVMVIKF